MGFNSEDGNAFAATPATLSTVNVPQSTRKVPRPFWTLMSAPVGGKLPTASPKGVFNRKIFSLFAKIKCAKRFFVVPPISDNSLVQAFQALSAFLQEEGAEAESFVLIGGSALLALGIVSRTTRDADIMARVDIHLGLVDPRPLSEALQSAARRVAEELDLDEGWLNTGPADQLAAGLPAGFVERLTERRYGTHLTVYLPGRIDLIHLKLFAAVDHGGAGRHVKDLAAMSPNDEELFAAANWVISQDSGEVFPEIVRQVLKEMGYERIAEQL